jgi:hypothetical protein
MTARLRDRLLGSAIVLGLFLLVYAVARLAGVEW